MPAVGSWAMRLPCTRDKQGWPCQIPWTQCCAAEASTCLATSSGEPPAGAQHARLVILIGLTFLIGGFPWGRGCPMGGFLEHTVRWQQTCKPSARSLTEGWGTACDRRVHIVHHMSALSAKAHSTAAAACFLRTAAST